MSVQAMAWAMDVPLDVVDSATARHVLLVLANYADVQGCHAFPSASSLARQTGLSIRSVRMQLAALLELGVIKRGNQAIVAAHIEQADRRPVVYDLCITGVHVIHPARAGCTSRQNGVNLTTERGERGAPNPSFTHQLTGGVDKNRNSGEQSGKQPPASEVMAKARPDPNKIPTPDRVATHLQNIAQQFRGRA